MRGSAHDRTTSSPNGGTRRDCRTGSGFQGDAGKIPARARETLQDHNGERPPRETVLFRIVSSMSIRSPEERSGLPLSSVAVVPMPMIVRSAVIGVRSPCVIARPIVLWRSRSERTRGQCARRQANSRNLSREAGRIAPMQEQHLPLRIHLPKEVVMSVWTEVLINLIGYAGFIGIATFHRPHKQLPSCRVDCS